MYIRWWIEQRLVWWTPTWPCHPCRALSRRGLLLRLLEVLSASSGGGAPQVQSCQGSAQPVTSWLTEGSRLSPSSSVQLNSDRPSWVQHSTEVSWGCHQTCTVAWHFPVTSSAYFCSLPQILTSRVPLINTLYSSHPLRVSLLGNPAWRQHGMTDTHGFSQTLLTAAIKILGWQRQCDVEWINAGGRWVKKKNQSQDCIQDYIQEYKKVKCHFVLQLL